MMCLLQGKKGPSLYVSMEQTHADNPHSSIVRHIGQLQLFLRSLVAPSSGSQVIIGDWPGISYMIAMACTSKMQGKTLTVMGDNGQGGLTNGQGHAHVICAAVGRDRGEQQGRLLPLRFPQPPAAG